MALTPASKSHPSFSTRRVRSRRVYAIGVILAVVVSFLQATLLPAAAQAADPQADAPMRMEVGPDNPLLLTQLNIGNDMGRTEGFKRNWNSGWSIGQVWASVPDDLKHNIGFVFHQGHNGISDNRPEMSAEWLEDNVAEADALGIPVFILWDEGKTLRSNSTRWAFLESLYQKYPHFMGTVVSEQADTLNDLPEALRIANLYGGFHVLGSIEETNSLAGRLEAQSYWDSVVQYSENFIFNPKNWHENFDSVNAWTQGAWLSGVLDNWGPYFDGYQYYGCGYFDLNPTSYNHCGDRWSRSQAETLASAMMLDQWQNGATVFHLENQLDIPTTGNLYSPAFWQSILPAMRHILTHPTPTRDDVIERTKVAFSEADGPIFSLADSHEALRSGNPNHTTFFSMYEKTPQLTAIQKGLWFYMRESGRYNIIPRIPKLAAGSLLDRFETVLTPSSYNATLQYGDARDAFFNERYPAISAGDAFVQKAGAEWLVYNSNERDNFTQDATLFLEGDAFTQLQMPEITPHTWAAVTEEQNAISVLLTNYATDREADLLKHPGRRDMEFNRNFIKYAYSPNPADGSLRTTTMHFDVATKPTLTIQGYDRNGYTYAETWDENAHRYTLTVRSNGVVDIRLSTSEHEAGWTNVAPDSDAVTTAGGATEVVFDGSSIAWRAPVGASGTASVAIDGVTVDPAVDVTGGGVVFRATGLSNSLHVLRVEGAASGAEFAYVPSVEHESMVIETNDFSYARAEDDEDLLHGSDGWRVIDGTLKGVGFEFPFYGDTTVYNTNAQLTNVRYEARMTLIQGTSGSLMVRGVEDAKSGLFFRLDPSRSAEGRNASVAYSCSLHVNGANGLNSWSPVATCDSALTLNPDQTYSVVVTADGSTVTASIDGTQVLSYSAAAVSSGYTGFRLPQSQSDAGFRFGQFVQLDDVKVTDLDSDTVVYESTFDTWAGAEGWMTETPLLFDWHEKPDPRSSFTFPWEWHTAGGSFELQEDDLFTSGLSGYFRARADTGSDFIGTGGGDATWAEHGEYDYWAWVRPVEGDTAGLLVRADESGGYVARIDTGDDTVAFGRIEGGEFTSLAEAPMALGDGWHLIEVTARGPLFTVAVDGRAALEAHDDELHGGGAGLWVPQGGAADIDEARVVARPQTPFTQPRGTTEVVSADGGQDRHITGFDDLAVKTARTVQPQLPATVTARYSDGTKAEVPVTWPAVPAEQLAVATNPTKSGPSRGIFTIEGTVEGTGLKAPVRITVMPNLVTAVTATGAYDPANPTVPDQTLGLAQFSDGARTWEKNLYVRWYDTPQTSPGSPTTQTITGRITSYPWATVTATMTVSVEVAAPGAPTAVTAEPGSRAATVTWTAPTSDGGAPITGYTVTAEPGGNSCSTTGATTCIVTGLDNGTDYTFRVVATNAKGDSPASEPSSPVTPDLSYATVADAPTDAAATAADAKAVVTWLPPAHDGGSTVTGYRVTATPGGETCETDAGDTACEISGLVNGTPYTFAVVALNEVGASAPSAPSAPVTPDATATVPGAPSEVVAIPGNGQAEVRWTAPTSDSGSAIIRSTVTASPGGASCSSTGTSCIVPGLENGTEYTFTVAARNALGFSEPSEPSASVTPTDANLALGKPVTSYYTFGGSTATNNANRAPAKMVDGVITPSTGGSSDSGYFTGGTSEGALLSGGLCSWAYVDLGADYRVGSYRIMFGQNVTSSGNRMWDSPYEIQVLSSAEAAASTTTLRNSSICPARTFLKGTGNYNTPSYVVSPENDIWTTVSSGVGTLTLDEHELTEPVTARYVRVLLNEPADAQRFGTAVMELEVYGADRPTVPDAPTAVTASVVDDTTAAVTWTAPRTDGGALLTGYTVTASPGGQTCTTTETTCTISGLEPGASTFTVIATNDVGSSVPSDASLPIVLGIPGVPLNVVAAVEGTGIRVEWQPPARGQVSEYRVYREGDDVPIAAVAGEQLSAVLTDLIPGSTHRFAVAAVGAGGEGERSDWTPPLTVPTFDAELSVTCLDGRAHLEVTVSNTAEVRADIVIDTPFRDQRFPNVAPGREVMHRTVTQLATVPAGEVVVEAISEEGSTSATFAYAALSCG